MLYNFFILFFDKENTSLNFKVKFKADNIAIPLKGVLLTHL